MNKRTEHMKMVNKLRSIVTVSIINFLDELEDGTGGDFDGFNDWDIEDSYKLKGQLNSYRAQKIAEFLGKRINKQKLTKYSKPKGYQYSMSNKDITNWLTENSNQIYRYINFSIRVNTGDRRSLY